LANGTEDDVPKIVASVMVSLPSLTLKTGFAYLRMKRNIRRSSKILQKELIENGVPARSAKQLAQGYEGDLSVRNLFKGAVGAARREEHADSSRNIHQTRWMMV